VIEGDGAMALGALHLIAARFVSEQMQLRTAGKQANGASPGPDAAPVIDLTDPAVWAALPPALE
jgi:hypothetical protein